MDKGIKCPASQVLHREDDRGRVRELLRKRARQRETGVGDGGGHIGPAQTGKLGRI
jgi:hypothetical protein